MSIQLLDKGPVLVVGATGQIGGEFLTALAQRNIRAVAACRDASVGKLVIDLEDPKRAARQINDLRPCVVVNAAAYTAVDRAQEERERARVINGEAPGVLAAACRDNDALLLHFSTDYVFDGSLERAYRETDRPEPLNEYGASKLEGEQRVLDSAAAHLVFRTSGVYAPHGQNFVATMLRLFRRPAPIGVVDDQILCPTSARHLAQLLVGFLAEMSASDAGCLGGLYHLCAAGETSWYDFAREIYQHAGTAAVAELRPITSEEFGAPAPRPARSVLDCALAREQLGLSLPHWRDQLEALMPEFNRRAA